MKILQILKNAARNILLLNGTFGLMLLGVAVILLLTGCTTIPEPSSNAVCAILMANVPSYSDDDTEQTKSEVKEFQDTIVAVCEDDGS